MTFLSVAFVAIGFIAPLVPTTGSKLNLEDFQGFYYFCVLTKWTLNFELCQSMWIVSSTAKKLNELPSDHLLKL